MKPTTHSYIFLTLLIASAFPTASFSPCRTHSTIPQQWSPTTSQLYMNKKKKQKPLPNTIANKGFASPNTVSTSSSTLIPPKVTSSFRYAGSIHAHPQTPRRSVPDTIAQPDYANDGIPKARPPLFPWIIEQKSREEIEKMRAAGRLARMVLDLAGREVKEGVTTDEIDRIVHEATIAHNAYPSPLNYHNFPKSCCTSINEVICHGIPDTRPLQRGDIVNLDITVYLNGYHGDCSEMFVVGGESAADESTRKLLQTTYDCWIKAMNFVQPGKDYKEIGAIIEDHVTSRGFTTVKSFCGHGIGSVFHTNPNILHYRNNEPAGKMAPGHTFTIEPMICEGDSSYVMWPDDWTATTLDGKRSAQFEHTLLITEDGVEALTGKIETSPVQFWERESEVHRGVWLGSSAGVKERESALNSLLLGEATQA
eukprot:CCRYP_015818-RA/>CCRYP_015818-RA protein AED:0.34 eAED:0.34 QI:90/1/1/1/1/1/2/58/423